MTVSALDTDAERLETIKALGGEQQGTYTPAAGGDGTDIYIIMELPGQPVLDGTVLATEPGAFARTSDLTGTPKGGTLEVDGTTYTILVHTPDGTGMSHVELKEA